MWHLRCIILSFLVRRGIMSLQRGRDPSVLEEIRACRSELNEW